MVLLRSGQRDRRLWITSQMPGEGGTKEVLSIRDGWIHLSP